MVETEQDLLDAIDRLMHDRELRAARVNRGQDLFVDDAAEMLEQELHRITPTPR